MTANRSLITVICMVQCLKPLFFCADSRGWYALIALERKKMLIHDKSGIMPACNTAFLRQTKKMHSLLYLYKLSCQNIQVAFSYKHRERKFTVLLTYLSEFQSPFPEFLLHSLSLYYQHDTPVVTVSLDKTSVCDL